jgi:FG-GAP-like repeat
MMPEKGERRTTLLGYIFYIYIKEFTMTRFSFVMNSFVCARLAGLVLVLPAVLSPMALGQSSFRSGMGAGVVKFDFDSGGDLFPVLIDTGDYNNDGLKDLLFGYSQFDDEVLVALGQADGQFEMIGPFIPSDNYEALSAGDLDGDGSIEFVMRRGFEVNILSLSAGMTQVEEPGGIWDLDENPFNTTFFAQVCGGDLDGDGGTDFVFNTTGDRVLVRWSSRDQNDPYETVLVPEIGDQNMIFPIGDYDGDSLPDLAVATSGGSSSSGPAPVVWEQTSPRVFEIVAQLPTGAAPGIAVTDAKSDGAIDILTVSDFDRSLMITGARPRRARRI